MVYDPMTSTFTENRYYRELNVKQVAQWRPAPHLHLTDAELLMASWQAVPRHTADPNGQQWAADPAD